MDAVLLCLTLMWSATVNTTEQYMLILLFICVQKFLLVFSSGTYGWQTLAIHFIITHFLTCFTYGVGVPAGLFIPTLLNGASFGRLCGVIINMVVPFDPIVCAHMSNFIKRERLFYEMLPSYFLD